jgi:hypothetical protein
MATHKSVSLASFKYIPTIFCLLLQSANYSDSSVRQSQLCVLYRNGVILATFDVLYTSVHSRVSSGSIVSDYGLDNRAIGVRSPAEAKDFSSNLCVQTGSGAHPASCTMGTGSPLPGAKARPGRDTVHSPPSSAEVEYE